MVEKYRTLEGNDLGVLAGGAGLACVNGIIIYRPMNNLVPDINRPDEVTKCLIEGTDFIGLSYSVARQVFVNNQSVWKNRNAFDLPSLGIDPFEQSYWGRGILQIELNANDAAEKIINHPLVRKLGMGIGEKIYS